MADPDLAELLPSWELSLRAERKSPATARSRHLALRRFSAWLVEERELCDDPLLGTRAPELDTEVVPILTEHRLKALIDACSGPDLRDRRDEAVVRLMTETGLRAGEVVAMALADVDLREGTAVVRRGEGGKVRTVPFGSRTGRALDRYVRLRRNHRLADSPQLWLGDRARRSATTACTLRRSTAPSSPG